MKKLLFLFSFAVLFFSCEEKVPEVEVKISVVGQTYSGYHYKSMFGGSNMYQGYEFFSADSCWDLLLEEDSRIISKKKRAYSLDYPEVKIYDLNAAAGYWVGNFSSDYLLIQSLKLKKW